MEFAIEVPDEVIEKIEHLIALGIADNMPMADYLVACVIADTRCLLEGHNVVVPKEWPDAENPT